MRCSNQGPRTFYVSGTNAPSMAACGTTARPGGLSMTCVEHVQETAPQFNSTRYMMNWNTSYVASWGGLGNDTRSKMRTYGQILYRVC